jgi:hypothetical protein
MGRLINTFGIDMKVDIKVLERGESVHPLSK